MNPYNSPNAARATTMLKIMPAIWVTTLNTILSPLPLTTMMTTVVVATNKCCPRWMPDGITMRLLLRTVPRECPHCANHAPTEPPTKLQLRKPCPDGTPDGAPIAQILRMQLLLPLPLLLLLLATTPARGGTPDGELINAPAWQSYQIW